MKALMISLRYLVVMTIILGVGYPIFSTVVGQILFPRRSMGSLVTIENQVRGSELIAQSFTQDKYFWPRPSGTGYLAVGAGGTNKSATNHDLKRDVLDRKARLGERAPADLLYSSASGIDPHISLEAVNFQKDRVGKARQLSMDKIDQLIQKSTDSRLLGFMGQVRVNVLELNKLLDEAQP